MAPSTPPAQPRAGDPQPPPAWWHTRFGGCESDRAGSAGGPVAEVDAECCSPAASRCGGEDACRAVGQPGRSAFHRPSFVWIRGSSLVNPLFAVCYSTCTERCAFIFISSNCFPDLMGSRYSHTIERKCIH